MTTRAIGCTPRKAAPRPAEPRNRKRDLSFSAYLSVFLAPLDSVGLQLGPIGIRSYMVPAVVVITAAAAHAWRPRNHVALTRLLVTYTILTVASLGWTVSMADTLQVAGGQVFLLLWVLGLLRLSAHGVLEWRLLARCLLAGVSVSAIWALLQTGLAMAGFDTGVWYSTNVPFPRPTGLTREPVWAALNATLGLGLVVFNSHLRTARLLFVALFSTVLVFTFSRAAIIATGVALAVVGLVIVFSRNGRARSQVIMALPFILCSAAILVILIPAEFTARFDIVGALGAANADVDQGALSSRVGVNAAIVDHWSEAAVVGHGAGAVATIATDPVMREIYAGGGELNSGRGASNLFLSNLYDLGAFGFLVVILIVWALFACSWRLRHATLGFLFLSIVLVLQFMASNGVRLGVAWAVFALVSGSGLAEERMRRCD